MTLFNKDLLGKTVFLLPYGNAAWGIPGNKLVDHAQEAVVTSIKRVKISLEIVDKKRILDGYNFREDVQPKISNDCNSGYYVFSSREEMILYMKAIDIRDRLRDNYNKITDQQAIEIANLLGWDV